MQHRLGVMVRPEMHQTATSDTGCYKYTRLFYYYAFTMIDHFKFLFYQVMRMLTRDWKGIKSDRFNQIRCGVPIR